MNEPREVWYRYEECGDFIALRQYPVIKHTPCGVQLLMTGSHWLDDDPVLRKKHMTRKFVLAKARRRYAYPTKELAWGSFHIRKIRHVEHLEHRLNEAKRALSLTILEHDFLRIYVVRRDMPPPTLKLAGS